MSQKDLDMVETALVFGLRGKPLRYVLKNDLAEPYRFVLGGGDQVRMWLQIVNGGAA